MFEPKSEARRDSRFARITVRGMLSTASAIAAGTMVAVCAAGGSYALWNDSAEIADVTISSGTVGLVVGNVPALNIDGLVPGSSVVTSFTASNIGNADLAVVLSGTEITGQTNGLASYLTLKLANVASAACTKDVVGTSGPAIGFASTGPVSIDAGKSTEYCLVVTLSASLESPQNSTASFTLTFNGTQRTS